MTTRQLIQTFLTKKDLNQLKSMTVSNIAMKCLNIFHKHIGNENAISRGQLFKRVYRRTEEISLADELRWDYLKRAMHLCRQRTKCFIGSYCYKGVWRYFVLKSLTDAEYYISNLDKNIKRMRIMQQKARKAVVQKWHTLKWSVKYSKYITHNNFMKLKRLN